MLKGDLFCSIRACCHPGTQQCSLYKACEESEFHSVGWRETLVLRFLPSQASQDHFPALPHCFLIFQPLGVGCALTFAGIMPCMFGYLELSMIVLSKRAHPWPNSSKKDVSFISIPANRAHPKQYSSRSLIHVFRIRERNIKCPYLVNNN